MYRINKICRNRRGQRGRAKADHSDHVLGFIRKRKHSIPRAFPARRLNKPPYEAARQRMWNNREVPCNLLLSKAAKQRILMYLGKRKDLQPLRLDENRV